MLLLNVLEILYGVVRAVIFIFFPPARLTCSHASTYLLPRWVYFTQIPCL